VGKRIHRFDPMRSGYPARQGRLDPYHCEWGVIVGDRIRRLRRDREMTLSDVCHAVPKPDGGSFTPGFFSRLERGWSSGALVTYAAVAAAFDVEPGRLLGPDDAQCEVSEAEMTLIRVLRQTDLAPHEAILRVLGAAPPEAGLAG
jgi:transcriptional regulator with XRE-family HTH domain